MKYAGADWVENVIGREGQSISPFGRRVADLLGQLYQGIYNAPLKPQKVDWSDDRYIEVNVTGHLASFDSYHLTLLVLLAHHTGIRVEVEPHTFHQMRLCFSPRRRNHHAQWGRHPTIEDSIDRLRHVVEALEPAPEYQEAAA